MTKYLTEDEIVEDLIRTMPAESVDSWKRVPKKELILGHHTTGRAIRNHYHLWDKDNPYTVNDPEPNSDGVIDHPLFPDQVSMRIMEKVWEKLNNDGR